MHEMALAEGVIATALEEARTEGRRLRSLRVRIGALQQIDREVFGQCLEAVRPDHEPLLEGLRIDLRVEPARLGCRACGSDYRFDDLRDPPGPEEREAIHFVPELAHAWVRCPACDSPDFDIIAGRGIEIEGWELEG